MTSAIAQNGNGVRDLEDALAYLPHKASVEYRRNQTIYDPQHPPAELYLIVSGRVKVVRTMEDGFRTVIGLFGPDEFFGQVALLGEHSTHHEQATTMERTLITSWSVAEIEAQIERRPWLGVALIQNMAGCCLDLQDRIQTLALDKTPERVVWGLMRLAKSGRREADGAIRIPPLTHQVLSEYLGTSREIVTSQMNELRRQGFVRYSRKAIDLFSEALAEKSNSHRRYYGRGGEF
jgi:CRP/FNR family transcriptional regulator